MLRRGPRGRGAVVAPAREVRAAGPVAVDVDHDDRAAEALLEARELVLETIGRRLPAWPFEKIASELPNFVSPTSFAVRRLAMSPDAKWATNLAWAYRFRFDWLDPPAVRNAAFVVIVGAYLVVVLAGTTTPDDAAGRALLASEKDREEHGYAKESARAALAPLCDDLEVDADPWLLRLDNLQHLATRLTGTLREPTHVLELVGALHPTAAVGGTPREVAVPLIGSLEGMDRARYAGGSTVVGFSK